MLGVGFGPDRPDGSVPVLSVEPEGQMAAAGIRVGDVFRIVDDAPANQVIREWDNGTRPRTAAVVVIEREIRLCDAASTSSEAASAPLGTLGALVTDSYASDLASAPDATEKRLPDRAPNLTEAAAEDRAPPSSTDSEIGDDLAARFRVDRGLPPRDPRLTAMLLQERETRPARPRPYNPFADIGG